MVFYGTCGLINSHGGPGESLEIDCIKDSTGQTSPGHRMWDPG